MTRYQRNCVQNDYIPALKQKCNPFLFTYSEVVSALRVSGLILRRAEGKEFHSYIPMLDYHVGDYEVLLRYWGSEPYSLHLGGFSGPMIAGEDPEETLLTRSSDWTKNLASQLFYNPHIFGIGYFYYNYHIAIIMHFRQSRVDKL